MRHTRSDRQHPHRYIPPGLIGASFDSESITPFLRTKPFARPRLLLRTLRVRPASRVQVRAVSSDRDLLYVERSKRTHNSAYGIRTSVGTLPSVRAGFAFSRLV